MLDPPSDWNDRDSSQAIVFIWHTHTHVSARQPAHCIVVHIQAPDTLNSVDCSSSMESALCSHKISLPSYDTLYFVISLLSLSLSLPPPLLLRVVIEIVHRFGDKRERTIARENCTCVRRNASVSHPLTPSSMVEPSSATLSIVVPIRIKHKQNVAN